MPSKTSKYDVRGAYHYLEFANPSTDYHKHVMNLLMNINRHLPGKLTLHEVGCGEGLILDQISKRFQDVSVSGNEADPSAVKMARYLNPKIEITQTDRIFSQMQATDVVLFSDSLEHIETFEEHINWAMGARYVIIAVPSEHDKHGLRDFGLHDFDKLFVINDFRCKEKDTRHSRHLTIWEKEDV
jgi:trans-aconitate methyltransferase